MSTKTTTPNVDALMERWSDDGATRGPAFVELRDLARDLEHLTSAQSNTIQLLSRGIAQQARAATAARKKFQQRETVDVLTFLLFVPFFYWISWWGILPALAIGTAINTAYDRRVARRATP